MVFPHFDGLFRDGLQGQLVIEKLRLSIHLLYMKTAQS
jgi:hypothetical protein